MSDAVAWGRPPNRRRRDSPSPTLALLVLALVLAGCATTDAPRDGPDGRPGAPPTLACAEPCLHTVHSGALFEPAVAADPRDGLRIVATSIDEAPDPVTGEPGWWPLAHASFDGGSTWTTTRPPGGPTAGPAHALARYTAVGDPVPAFLPDGTVLLSGIADARIDRGGLPFTKTGDSVVVWRSHDGGITWPDAGVVYEGQGVSSEADVLLDEQDKQWFAVGSDGTVLLAWVRIEEGTPDHPSTDERVSIVVASSTDGGATWSAPASVVTGVRLQGPFPLVLADGAWLLSYVAQATNEAHTAVSRDRGVTWQSMAVAASTRFPVLAKGVGPAGERVFLAYPATRDGYESEQTPTLRWSDDAGATWSAPMALDVPDAAGPTLPALAASGDGTAYVTFWHPEEVGAEIMAVAVRNGKTSAPLTLDATASSSGQTGHYMGLAALPDGGAFAVWNADRGKTFEVTGARLVSS